MRDRDKSPKCAIHVQFSRSKWLFAMIRGGLSKDKLGPFHPNWKHIVNCLKSNIFFSLNCNFKITFRGVTGEWAGWAIAHPVVGRNEGSTGQQRCDVLILAHQVLGRQLRPWPYLSFVVEFLHNRIFPYYENFEQWFRTVSVKLKKIFK